MLELQKRIGRNLAALRGTTKLSQTELAAEVMIHRSTYADYEHGARLPDMQVLMQLAAYHNVYLRTLIYCDVDTAIQEHFLLQDRSDRELHLSNLFRSLSDNSKGQLMLFAEQLAKEDEELRANLGDCHYCY